MLPVYTIDLNSFFYRDNWKYTPIVRTISTSSIWLHPSIKFEWQEIWSLRKQKLSTPNQKKRSGLCSEFREREGGTS